MIRYTVVVVDGASPLSLEEEEEDNVHLRHDNLLEAVRSVTRKRHVWHTLVNGPRTLVCVYTLELCIDVRVCVCVRACVCVIIIHTYLCTV